MLPDLAHKGRYLYGSLTGKKEGSKGFMVLRVKPTPTGFPTNSLSTPMDNTPLHSTSSMRHLWGDRCGSVIGKDQ